MRAVSFWGRVSFLNHQFSTHSGIHPFINKGINLPSSPASRESCEDLGNLRKSCPGWAASPTISIQLYTQMMIGVSFITFEMHSIYVPCSHSQKVIGYLEKTQCTLDSWLKFGEGGEHLQGHYVMKVVRNIPWKSWVDETVNSVWRVISCDFNIPSSRGLYPG